MVELPQRAPQALGLVAVDDVLGGCLAHANRARCLLRGGPSVNELEDSNAPEDPGRLMPAPHHFLELRSVLRIQFSSKHDSPPGD